MLCFGKGFKGSGCFPDAVCQFPNRQSIGVYGKTASNFYRITAFLFPCHLAIILFLFFFFPNTFLNSHSDDTESFWSIQLTLEMWLLFYIFTPFSFLYKLRQKIHLVKKTSQVQWDTNTIGKIWEVRRWEEQESKVRLYYIVGHCLYPPVCPNQVRRQSIVQW